MLGLSFSSFMGCLVMGEWQPPRLPLPAASGEQRPRRIVHLNYRSFSHYDLDLGDDGDGRGGDGQRHHKHNYHRQQREEEEEEGEWWPQGQHQHPHGQHRDAETGCKRVTMGFSRWGTFSYYRLPEQPLRLVIVKLDGSSFDVLVRRSTSVLELKLAVEQVFTQSPKEDGNISWSHVWGHFCLCYNGHKLIDDKTFLRTYGIKDGDKLHFIRHLSINYNLVKHRPRKNVDAYEQQKMGFTRLKESEGSKEDEIDSHGIKSSLDYDDYFLQEHYEEDEYDDIIAHSEFKLAHFLRGWLSYSGLWCSGRTRVRTRIRPSRLGNHCPKPGKR